ncbi:HAD-IC family P-type ATPase [Fructilactobacillus sp. Tb1]|uniref:HAD-IC family P-type ATPase n=1 Tax=Fructilactobacillus sp. Tb1 TaxID=3422304 RepID=UPI003D26F43A
MIEKQGLTETQVKTLLKEYGSNDVSEPNFSFSKEVAKRLWGLSAWILEGALLLELILGKDIQALFIIIMLLFAAVDGAIQSKRANKVLNSISNQLTPTVSVKRSGKWIETSSKNLVPGDLIALKPGDVVPADAKILDNDLEVNESSITGESKSILKVTDQTVLSGTSVISGSALAEVIRTGKNSRMGKTINLIHTSKAPGQLQKILSQIIKYLAIFDAGLVVILLGLSVIRHENLISMLPFIAMLFIATIPIAMPSSFAVANSVEANVLSKQGVLVGDLTGIQDAANLDLLFLDKTGTITANNPAITHFYNLSNQNNDFVFKVVLSVLDAKYPTEIDKALQKYINNHSDNQTTFKITDFLPFDSSIGYSQADIYLDDVSYEVRLGSLKVLNDESTDPVNVAKLNLAPGRTVAVSINQKIAGIFVMEDQPRKNSAKIIADLKQRKIRPFMITGDNTITANAIAKVVGLDHPIIPISEMEKIEDYSQISGFSNVKPEDKLKIVKLFQAKGYIVGMTGDGVNDAPALKQANVGMAMKNAVYLAKRAAKMVLLKPGLTEIPNIIDSGHRVYQRMITWALTKLSRTAELTSLITFGYIFYRFIPLSLNAMILVAILNDIVTLVLGTDNTHISKYPEKWNLKRMSVLGFILAVGWTLPGLLILRTLIVQGIANNQISTMLFLYLMFSAMMTILITRTKKMFWQSRPSNALILAIIFNVILSVLLAKFGIGLTVIAWSEIWIILLLTIMIGIILDFVYLSLAKLISQK